ncbi:type I-E CRISPR-associated protein Cas6/Cse3/CasE [Tessaracoccus sp. Z1128]
MTFLSKIRLNPLRSGAQRLLQNPQRLHAALLGAFPPQHEAEGRLLWRLEVHNHHADVVALSGPRPDWTHLVEHAGWPNADGGEPIVADYQPLLALIATGREFAFRTTLNTVSTSARPHAPTESQSRRIANGRKPRVGQRTAEHQINWFLARAADEQAQWGFTVGSSTNPRLRVTGRDQLRFTRRPGEPPVTLNVATFEGVLRVTDSERTRSSLVDGIGKGKAYGCGLVTLARPEP